MERRQRYRALVLFLFIIAIFSLAIIKDNRFNRKRIVDACEVNKRDSLECEQMNRLSEQLNEITVQLDSISSVQNANNVNEIQDIDSIKATLNQIKRTGQRIINLMK